MLTESQVEQYFEDGYVTPDFKFPEEVILSIQSRHEKRWRHILNIETIARQFWSMI